MSYIICIPSYNREFICNKKTLTTLHNNNINPELIYVYVANKTEYEKYSNILNKNFYNKIIVGVLGLVNQRQFIINQFEENKNIIFMDDDIENIDLSISKYSEDNLDYFLKEAFEICKINKSFIWGIYPVFNPFFRKSKNEFSKDLKYIVGAIYGIINRPNLNTLKLSLTEIDSQKEDVERTIKYFIEDGIVIRFNTIGFKTKYYGSIGGLGTFKDRLEPMKQACIRLNNEYSNYGKIKIRPNGMNEFVLKIKRSKI